MHYTTEYAEPVVLEDGEKLLFRVIRPADRSAMAAAFERLSPLSRYRRFFGPKTSLTEQELGFFTECDGEKHFAIVAVALNDDGSERDGVGVARFVRLYDEPETVEIAMLVTDDWQHRGIGRQLLGRIVAAAAERGVRQVRAHVLAENIEMRGLLASFGEDATVRSQDGVLIVDFPVEPLDAENRGAVDAMLQLCRLIADGAVIVPMTYGLTSLLRNISRFAVGRAGSPGDHTRRHLHGGS